ncbi:C1 family peptidase [Nocardia terpenica]|uniref:C1 family peptidase n=1 Tax=Nocardia terpenica TaxID=455432 RepID=UPI0009EE416C|nr:C1 family peptidase [Nocardia terpenica]NQE92489.1 C1 family peptidase [Nocardia terpenica]
MRYARWSVAAAVLIGFGGAGVAAAGTGAPPGSYSLLKYALSPGDQGQTGQVTCFATGYTGYGVLMNEQGIPGGPMSPAYVCSQVDGGLLDQVLSFEQQQGIDTAADYPPGSGAPTDAQRANAARYKLSGYQDLSGTDRRTAVETAIAAGQPVVFGFEARDSFETLTKGNANYNPQPTERVLGGHAVTIVAYDENGITAENSWGTTWGDGGFFTAPWSLLTGSDVDSIYAMGMIANS